MSRGKDGRRLRWCKRTGRVFVLGGCKRGKLSAKLCPCGQLDCLTCADGPEWASGDTGREGSGVVGRRRAGRLYERLGAPALGRLVMTWPDSSEVGGPAAILLREASHNVAQAWCCETWGVDEVGVHSFGHPCGDRDPRRWRPHVHLQVPLFGALLSPSGGFIQAMGPLAPHVGLAHLHRLREYMGAVLDAHGLVSAVLDGDRWYPVAGLDGRRLPDREPHRGQGEDCGACAMCGFDTRAQAIASRANVWYQHEDVPVEKLHSLRYDGRTFPAWYAGDVPRSLRIGRSTGLLAPNRRLCGARSRKACGECAGCRSLAAWREAIRATPPAMPETDDPVEQVRAGLLCYCGCGAVPVILGCEDSRGWHHVVVDAWALPRGSPELAEVAAMFGRGPPGKVMHDHQPGPTGFDARASTPRAPLDPASIPY